MKQETWTVEQFLEYLATGKEPGIATSTVENRHTARLESEMITSSSKNQTGSRRPSDGLKNDMSERVFQAHVENLFRNAGWLVYHTHDSRRSEPGFPDLVMTNQQRVIFAELKTERGKLRPEQEMWLSWLRIAGQEVYIWRPSDLGDMSRILSSRLSEEG